jgi:uncharacterized protein (UPF0371 family)
MHLYGFDNDKYLKEQTASIMKMVKRFSHKLYLEFGGKLLFDYHASRVLPGFDPNVKMRLLNQLKENADIVLCVYAGDIERKKVRADFGITYDMDVLKLIDDLRSWDLDIVGVVITRYNNQPAARLFKNKLERRNIRVYTHRYTKGYPNDVDTIVSDKGYGANEYIETTKPLVIVTAPGPGSGKLATCLSQLYHDYKRGLRSGYAKFETFPIWNLPLDHPVNVAYASATADLGDFIMIDPFHLEAYGITSVNYNRDVEVFPVLKKILEKITGEDSPYQSPTDMGVNRAGFGIINDDIVRKAAKEEIIRRYFQYKCEYAKGLTDLETVKRAECFMKDFDLIPEDRKVVIPAREVAKKIQACGNNKTETMCGAAIQLADGSIITGKDSSLMHAASSLILNSIKYLAGIPDNIHLLSPIIIESIKNLKRNNLDMKNLSLNVEETLIALSISATTNPTTQAAMAELGNLKGCEAHFTHILPPIDQSALRKLGINLTSDPDFPSEILFMI